VLPWSRVGSGARRKRRAGVKRGSAGAGALFVCCLLACRPAPHAPQPRVAQGPIRHVVLVSIDGLVPDSYLHPDEHGLQVPTLRRFVAQGAFSDGALATFPSVTYPAHTSMVTGVWPSRHGIVSNHSFDPLDKNNGAWFWYSEELKAKPIWTLAFDAGYETALISWPVTVGARATWLVVDYWRANNAEDLKLVRALSTPGLAQRVEQSFPGYASRAAPPNTADQAGVDVASQILREGKPTLLLLHIFQVDTAQHGHGVWSEQARAAIETADQQLARLLAAVERAGIFSSTAFVVASDHGFANVTRQLHPRKLLQEHGFLELDADGKVSAWKASCVVNGGSAYVYVKDGDAQVARQVTELFRTRAAEAGSGIARVLSGEEIAQRGGDPAATLAIEAELGVSLGGGLVAYETPPKSRAVHGYDPERPEMKASLLLLGPSIRPGLIKDARLIDIAPTIAAWLSLDLLNVEGRPLSSPSR
jgi:predicted AlkP superfamily pyrophosphatase or phosphodiesterase